MKRIAACFVLLAPLECHHLQARLEEERRRLAEEEVNGSNKTQSWDPVAMLSGKAATGEIRGYEIVNRAPCMS